MMKKKGLFLTIVSVALVALTGAAVALAAWVSVLKTETNTIKIGEAVEISISGFFDGSDELIPGGFAEKTFTLDLTDADFVENTYALEIVDIDFDGKNLTYQESDSELPVWTYQFNSESPAGLAEEGCSVALASDTTSVTLKLTLNAGVPTSYENAQLTFKLEIKATPIAG
jgi:hypothetical protein